MRRLLAVAPIAVLLLAAPAAARVRVLGEPQLGHPTLLGGRMVFESPGVSGDGESAYVLVSASTSGGARRKLVSAPTTVIRSGGVVHTTAYAYAATPTHLALAELDGSSRAGHRLGSVTLSFSALSGKATETIASCDQPEAPHAPPFAVDGARIAFVEGACEAAPETVVVHELGVADVRIPVPAGYSVRAVAVAGDYVAYALEPPAGAPPAAVPRVIVASRATGAEAFHIDGTGGPLALQADGTVAATGGTCPATLLVTASPAAPTPQLVSAAHPCSPLRIAGGRVVYRDAQEHLRVASVGGADQPLVDAPVGDFDADGRDAVYTFPDCAGRALFRVGLTERPATQSVPGSCPVRVRKLTLSLRGTRVIVPLACPRACQGRVELRRGTALGSAPFTVTDPGTGSAVIGLGARARRLPRGRGRATLTLRTTIPGRRPVTSRVAITVVR